MKKWSQIVLIAMLAINVFIIVGGSMHIQSMERKGMHRPPVKTKIWNTRPCIKSEIGVDAAILDSIREEMGCK